MPHVIDPPARASATRPPHDAGGLPAVALRPLVVLVPAFNEVERIEEVITGLRHLEAEAASHGLNLEVFVIDDGSQDGTRERAEQVGAHRVLRHLTNRGLGASVRTGLIAARNAGAAIAVKFDADLQHDPADVIALIRPILNDEADIVYGDRTERIAYRMPPIRRIGNAIFTGLTRWLTGWPLRDSQPGIFAVSSSYLEDFFLPGDYNYTQQILIDAYHKGMRFEHVPVAFRPRAGGRSFISLRYPFKVLPQIVLVLAGVRPMKVFGPLGFSFLSIAVAVAAWQVGGYWLHGAEKPVRSVNFVLGTGLFGLQVFLFGLLAELIVRRPKS